jgi:hypothetical protein
LIINIIKIHHYHIISVNYIYKVKRYAYVFALILFYLNSWGQNTLGLPQILNFNNNNFQGGSQTWDIRQDAAGRMYFANNEGLLVYDAPLLELIPAAQ